MDMHTVTMRIPMRMVVRVLPVVVCMHLKSPTRDPLPRLPLKVQMNLVTEPQCRHRITKNLLADPQIPQRADRHVAGNS